MTYDEQALPPIEALMPVLQFDAQDLRTNRDGQLGDGQRKRLQAAQTRAIAIGAGTFTVLTLFATTLLFIGVRQSLPVLLFAGILTTIINAIAVGMFGRQWLRLRIDLRTGAVETVSGVMERVVRANGRINNFVLRVDDDEFFVKKDLFNLVRQDVPYRMYRAPHSRLLLALEPTPQN